MSKRYVLFRVRNGYVGHTDSSDPVDLEDYGIGGSDTIDSDTEDQVYEAAREFMWESNYAPDFWWEECDENGNSL